MRASFVQGTINPASSGGSTSGFIPQPGFVVSVTGSFAWDATITITDSNNRFGPNGPIMLVFDDFRNGTPGATMGPSAPVSGIGRWIVDTRSPEISPYIFGPANSNAAGTGPCVRALNGEVSGAGGIFARGMEMVLGGEYTQLYSFRNERWNGWNGRNNNGGGGGYYKHEWFLDDGSFGSTAFDVIMPLFIERTTQLSASTIVGTPTWSGGLVTVTVNTGSQCFGGAATPPVIGSTFTAQIGNSVGGNYATFTPWVPAAYNGAFPGAVVTATGGSPGAFTATFTYPLATNPGPVTTKGTLSDYGAYGTGVPSLSIDTNIGGNSSGSHGLPVGGDLNGKGPSSWNGAAFANDTWDQTGWNSIETYYLADQTAPATNNGIRGGALFNAVNNQAYNHIVTPAAPLMGTPSPPWGSFNNWRSMGLLQDINANGAPITIDRSDHIVFLGNSVNSAAARFMLHDQPVLANSTMIMPLTDPSAWSAGSATLKLRQGRFPAAGPAGAYMSFFAATAPNTQVLVGQFAPAVNFDFFISTTGSDANPGTQDHPWALTSLINPLMTNVFNSTISANQAKMAGKKIGVLPGTYNLQSYVSTGFGINWQESVLVPPSGTATNPTLLQSTVPLGAIINFGLTDANNPGNTSIPPMPGIGGSFQKGSQFFIIDGFELTNTNYVIVQLGTNKAGLGFSICRNCYVHNVVSSITGENASGITAFGVVGCVVQNNYISNITSPGVNRNSAIELWGCQSSQVIYNTIVMNNGGADAIYIKNTVPQAQKDITIAYNYCDLSAAPSLGGSGICGWDINGAVTDTSSFHHNIIVGVESFRAGIAGVTNANVPENQQFYNNTFVTSGAFNPQALYSWGKGPVMTVYNNITAGTGAGFDGMLTMNADNPALVDYNLYQVVKNGLNPAGSGPAVPSSFSTTLSAWQSALATAAPSCIGKEAHSLTGAPTFVGGTPALPGQAYKLANGSLGQGTGSSNGQTSGTAIDMGAWGGTDAILFPGQPIQQVGCSFAETPNV